MSTISRTPIHLAVIAPPLALLSALISLSDIPIRVPEPYVVGVTSESVSAVFLIAPIAAALAAWEAGRVRRAGWHRWPNARPMYAVALRALKPVVAVALFALATGILARFVRSDLVTLPDLALVTKAVAIVVTHALLGFAVGLELPATLAAPSMLILDYAWMVLPVSLQPVWLRHLNGTWISCCAVYVEIAPRAWWAAIIIALAIGIVGLVLMTKWPALHRGVTVTGVGVAAAVIASVLVSELGPDPTEPRNSAELVCSESKPRVCVWPEHGGRLLTVANLVVTATSAWRTVGLPVGEEYTEQRSAVGDGIQIFGFTPHSRDADIVAGLASGVVPMARCDPSAPPLRDARDYARAWLLQAASVDPRRAGYPIEVAQTVDAVRGKPMELQRQWLSARLACVAVIPTEAQ
jgi:hypothetical protein